MEYQEDIESLKLALSREEEFEIYQQYIGNQIPDEENKYDYINKALHNYFTPFNLTIDRENILIEKHTNNDINCILSNIDDYYSTHICNNENKPKNNKFEFEKYITGATRLEVQDLKKIKWNLKE